MGVFGYLFVEKQPEQSNEDYFFWKEHSIMIIYSITKTFEDYYRSLFFDCSMKVVA